MKFSIELNSSELVEAINNGSLLALAEITSKTDTNAIEAAKIINNKEKAVEITAEEKEPMQKSAKDTKSSAKTNSETETSVSNDSKTYTFIEVREKLASLSRAGKQAQIKALIEKFGATKLSEVKEEDYAALMEEAEGL